jgi:hypothetical protein
LPKKYFSQLDSNPFQAVASLTPQGLKSSQMSFFAKQAKKNTDWVYIYK